MGRWSVAKAGVVALLLAPSCASDEAGGWGKEAVAYVDASARTTSSSLVDVRDQVTAMQLSSSDRMAIATMVLLTLEWRWCCSRSSGYGHGQRPA